MLTHEPLGFADEEKPSTSSASAILQNLTDHITQFAETYQSESTEIDEDLEKAEEMSRTTLEPFLLNLVATLHTKKIISRVEVKKDKNGEISHPRTVEMIITQIYERRFSHPTNVPKFKCICSGNKRGAINVSFYALNAGRMHLGMITTSTTNFEKTIGQYIERGFERLFRVLQR